MADINNDEIRTISTIFFCKIKLQYIKISMYLGILFASRPLAYQCTTAAWLNFQKTRAAGPLKTLSPD